jgi:hypothetical protein
MPDNKEQFETEEEIPVEVTAPLDQPTQLVTTDRKTPIKRGLPLSETHGMTTEANRFKEN